MKILGIVGWKNSGKTTLVSRLLPALAAQGFGVSTLKHAHHEFDVDQPGKDSYIHRQAGAHEVLITSARRWVLMHEARDEPEAELGHLLRRLSPVDVVLVEGFKRHSHPKIEVHRRNGTGEPAPLLCRDDPDVIALVTDEEVGEVPVPKFRSDELDRLVAFLLPALRLAQEASP